MIVIDVCFVFVRILQKEQQAGERLSSRGGRVLWLEAAEQNKQRKWYASKFFK